MANPSIRVTADTSQAQAALGRLSNSLGSLEGGTNKAQRGLAGLGSTARLAVGAFAALTASLGIGEIIDYTTRWTDLNSRLINATGNQHAAAEAMDAISKSARGTYSSLEQTAEVFVRNSMALNELGYTTSEQIKVSEALNNAIAVSGARGQQAASALDAFAKSMARGKLDGEDFNRIVENTPRLTKALADGLGVTTQELRNMVTEGKLSSDVVIPALISQMGKLKTEADEMPATITDAFVVLNNSLFELIGSMDSALGISTSLAAALVFVADNTGVLVGALGGLLIAVGLLLAPLIKVAAVMAIVFGGAKLALIIGIGAAIGFAAQKLLSFLGITKDTVDPMKEQATAAEEAAAAIQRQADAARKLLEEQTKGVKPLLDKLNLEKESIGLNQTELAVKKNLAEAAKTLKIEEDKIVEAVRQQIIESTTALQLAKQESEINKNLADLETERIGLAIQDTAQREIALTIRKLELDFGRDLNAVEKERLTTAIQMTQAMREQADIKKAITDFTREQTELEKIQRAIGLQSSLDPNSALEKQYQRDQAALQTALDNKLISEQQYNDQRLALEEQFNFKKLDLQNQEFQNYNRINKLKEQMDLARIERTLMAEKSGSAAVISEQDRAVLQRVGQEERQKQIVNDRIQFEKKSEMEKTQFGIQQGAELFNALGAQNKKAFEIAKAFNIANAIMNTYMAATKALATYPPPFNFIAAAAAIGMGLAQVAQIRSQQYSGRQLGGPVMGGQTYMVGEGGPELFTPNTTGSITRNSDLGGAPVNISFNIQANDAEGFDDLLIQRRGMIQQMVSDAITERGQRSIL